MDTPALPTETATTAATRAYRYLESQIVTLELAPGSVWTEGALLQRAGLGRTPVREAIQHLSWDGLLEVRPRAGVLVAPLHPGDWLRVLDARRGLEIVLARSAARFVTREASDRFHDAALAMQKAVLAGSVFDFLEADKAFDECLALAADNPFAARLARPLQTHSRRFWYRYQSENGLAEAAEHHVSLIGAIIEGDVGAAETKAGELVDLLYRYARVTAAP